MESKTVIIRNKAGIHCRPSSAIMTVAAKFPGHEFAATSSRGKVNLNSILDLLSMGLQKGDEVSKQNNSDKEKKDYVVFERTKWLSITTMALILISIFISCFLRYPVIVAISFALAIGSYIANSIMYKRNEKSVFEEIEQRILERNEKFKSDMENYDSNYRKRMYEALNKKMVSLGLETVSEDKFAGEEK